MTTPLRTRSPRDDARRPQSALDTWRARASQPGWAMLPLRLFLGVTMFYASLTKLLDPSYLDATAPGGVQRQMELAAASSPIGGLVSFSAEHAAVAGLLIAFGELAVGLGMLLGLFTRFAAAGGLLLSLSFFLTVSWGTSPYFYGPDIVFLFAFTPFVVAGDGGVLSLQAALRRRVRQQMHLPAEPIGIEGDAVTAEVDRRSVIRAAAVAGLVGAGAVILGATATAVRRGGYQPVSASGATDAGMPVTASDSTASAPVALSPAASSAAPAPAAAHASTQGAPAGGKRIAKASAVPVGSALKFTDPKTGKPAYVVQPKAGTFLGFSAVCTHQGCTVGFDGHQFACPCHGARFDDTTGDVTRGPARSPLPRVKVVEAGGTLYVV